MLTSPYFRRTVQAWVSNTSNPWQAKLTEWLEAKSPPSQNELSQLFSDAKGIEPDLSKRLRKVRQLLMMRLINLQAQGLLPLEPGLGLISQLACWSVQAALDQATSQWIERFGQPCDAQGKPQGLIVVGMGKLGGNELNPSSDIDLIFLFREPGQTDGLRADGTTTASTISCEEFFARVTRDCCSLIHEITADGFVFRVDTRLRPHGDSGPPALSLNALELYLQDEARDWERFAWLKGRVIAKAHVSGEHDENALEQLLRPFVYRRYLDFGAFASLRDVHKQIRQQSNTRDQRRLHSQNPGWDVKLGKGGIREIEFSVQLIQLLRGSRHPELRTRNTLEALAVLESLAVTHPELGLPAQTCQVLRTAYCFYRRLENALQWRDDQQTQWLPHQGDALAEIAQLFGPSTQTNADSAATTPEQLWQQCSAHQAAVGQIFSELMEPGSANKDANPNQSEPETSAPLASALPDQLDSILTALRTGRRYLNAKPSTVASIENLLRITLVMPSMQDASALSRLCNFFEQVMGRPSYLSMLEQYPAALQRLAGLLARAQWTASYIQLHPIVLDELLDGSFLAPMDLPAWQSRLQAELTALEEPEDLERQMDLIREAHHAQVFRLLAKDLENLLTVEALADELSALADAVLNVSLRTLWPKILKQFKQDSATPLQLGVIAYGKLGGKELGYASDLDLVFIYDDNDDTPRAVELYSRLIQRLGQWLSLRTGAGYLFECDYRLRPNGDAGMWVNSVSSFEDYQVNKAWLWEHQALTRARVCFGSEQLVAQFDSVRRKVLISSRQKRTVQAIHDEIQAMREKMHQGHPNRSALFDIKHDKGGMVDIEFIVQTLVLEHSANHPALLDNLGNIALLGIAAKEKLIDAEAAKACQEAYRQFRQWQHSARLKDSDFARVEHSVARKHIESVRRLWTQVFSLSTTA